MSSDFIEPTDGAPARADLARRFGGVARLYGDAGLDRFARARVALVGIGGVGTWAAEALARTGVGALTLIDLDHIAESNTNRQIHALDPDFGKAKVQAMAERIRAIHPGARVTPIEEFVTPDNVADLVRDVDAVLDCIDQARAKIALIAHARACGLAIVTCGAAGGRRDPAQVRRDDLARAHGDALLARVRAGLRRAHGFAGPGSGRRAPPRLGVDAVYSAEVPCGLRPPAPGDVAPGSPLACGGYGSAVTVTATMGFAAAACVLERLQGA